ncbi:hypothetical protein RI578_03590 [Streptomyces sp. BB1-1-1]|uniref:hypothetical protein n=1 Tax=Streptomyces sp. BB1-1-1 TaxID=3074430 RepID=UPI002877B960|nr:hypothetical protein [Streptomyces sp. BB1-1-1]WND33428.1 hypothetical protein RI578_03590 [Streptomyces sp. BB1-1-1]
MTDHRLEGPGENGAAPVPRDMPDQQAGTGDDPWEAAAPTREQREQGQRSEGDEGDEEARTGDTDDARGDTAEPAAGSATDVPDTDEAGTGRQGEPQSGAVHPEHPAPDESSG